MSEKLYLYPVWLRLWHAFNALLILALIASGLIIQNANADSMLLRFDLSISIHNVSGVLLSVNYLFFILGNVITGNIRFYILEWKGLLGRLIQQSNYYMKGMFKGEQTPFPVNKDRKFNPLQKVSYIVAMYVFVPLVIITGLALIFPETIIPRVVGFSGIQLTAMLHATAGFLISIFLMVHVYICTTGKPISKNFKSIITGWHE